jgi:hypothetical protein
MFRRPTISCLLNCIIETIEVTEGRVTDGIMKGDTDSPVTVTCR